MKKHGMNKKQAEKILATAVMGMNLSTPLPRWQRWRRQSKS